MVEGRRTDLLHAYIKGQGRLKWRPQRRKTTKEEPLSIAQQESRVSFAAKDLPNRVLYFDSQYRIIESIEFSYFGIVEVFDIELQHQSPTT